jgi:hypothetical protein
MHSLLPATRGIMTGKGSDPMLTEMAQKNAGLWIQYSALSLGRSCGTELLDNGGIATVPVCVSESPQKTTAPEYEEWAEGGFS